MRTLQILKRIDVWAQVLSLCFALVYCVVRHLEGFTFVVSCYVVVGSVQVISCLLNRLLLVKEDRDRVRGAYEIILTVIAISFALGGLAVATKWDGLIAIFGVICYAEAFLLLFGSPLLAMLYFGISYKEMKHAARFAHRKMFADSI